MSLNDVKTDWCECVYIPILKRITKFTFRHCAHSWLSLFYQPKCIQCCCYNLNSLNSMEWTRFCINIFTRCLLTLILLHEGNLLKICNYMELLCMEQTFSKKHNKHKLPTISDTLKNSEILVNIYHIYIFFMGYFFAKYRATSSVWRLQFLAHSESLIWWTFSLNWRVFNEKFIFFHFLIFGNLLYPCENGNSPQNFLYKNRLFSEISIDTQFKTLKSFRFEKAENDKKIL